jgi:hypothetical protein
MVDTPPPPAAQLARPTTRPGRVVAALALGAACGAVLVSGSMILLSAFTGETGYGLLMAAFAFPFALVGWTVGLVVVGTPIWWLLRRSNARPTRLAPLVGAGVTALLMGGWSATLNLISGDADLQDLLPILEFGLFGWIVGWVVARVAYGRPGVAR